MRDQGTRCITADQAGTRGIRAGRAFPVCGPSRLCRNAAAAAAFLVAGAAHALDRFPRPEFEGGHVIPTTSHPHPLPNVFAYVDVSVLVLALAAAAYVALRRRSRPALLVLTCCSLAYFGFWRKGCVCAVGSVQNVMLALFDSSYALPATVLAFFLLPLVCALLWGRVFCAAVCPLGALQDVTVWKPVRVPRWLAEALGMIPYLYLALALLFAATRSLFIVCAFDPFVSMFRLGGTAPVLVMGGCFLVLGLFVARPYCRFLCPYSVLLRWLSRLSWRHVTITPDECIQCRLCEDACPFGAIRTPTEAHAADSLRRELVRLGLLIALVPVLALAGNLLGRQVSRPLSFFHPAVRLAAQFRLEETGQLTTPSLYTEAARIHGASVAAVYRDAEAVQKKFATGCMVMGCFIGAALGVKLCILSVRRRRKDFEPDRGSCLSCGRCFSYCPRERVRRARLEGGTHA